MAIKPGFKPNYSDPTKHSGASKWEQRRRLAAALRELIHTLVPRDVPEEELQAMAEQLEAYVQQIREHPGLKYSRTHEQAAEGDYAAYFDQSPLLGLSNPLAPPIAIRQSGETTATATLNFGAAYEGTPKTVHGGYVAAVFDELLGYVQFLSGQIGVTANIQMKYLKPTPINTDLVFEAQYLRTEGRKIFASARALAGDQVTAEAEAMFIAIELDRT